MRLAVVICFKFGMWILQTGGKQIWWNLGERSQSYIGVKITFGCLPGNMLTMWKCWLLGLHDCQSRYSHFVKSHVRVVTCTAIIKCTFYYPLGRTKKPMNDEANSMD